jgi:4-hydroxybenzoate polyprenyltransferase
MKLKLVNKIKIFLEMIKFEHTIFALPFAYLGAALGNQMMEGTFPNLLEWVWITLAMVGARSAAMGLNRLIDSAIDQANPRTSKRAIPAGLLSKIEVLVFILVSFFILFYSALQLNSLAVILLPVAVFFLVIYSYTKRFTWLCHIILGITIGLAPLGGWVGATGTLTFEAFLLFFSIVFWIAGFDIIYASQDAEYDKNKGLYSIPSYFGVKKGLQLARGFHVLAFIFFASLYFMTSLSTIYIIGVVISGLIMTYEHRLVSHHDLSKVNVAFFTMNGILSMVMFIFSIGDLLL